MSYANVVIRHKKIVGMRLGFSNLQINQSDL